MRLDRTRWAVAYGFAPTSTTGLLVLIYALKAVGRVVRSLGRRAR